MVANLPPEYYAAEEEYRAAKSKEEQIKCLEKMLSSIPQHKASQKVRGELRRKISLLSKEMETEARRKKGAARKGIKKDGAAQVCLVGMPNTGKSYILNNYCGKNLASTPRPYETVEPEVGMIDIGGVKVQLIEIPSVYPGIFTKRGELRGIINSADAFCFLVNEPNEFEFIKAEMDINKKYIVFNSYDEHLKEKIWNMLGLIRVYTKIPGKKVEEIPVALKQNANVGDLGKEIHKDFIKKFRYARVFRKTGKINEIKTGLKFILHEGDIIEFHTS